MTKEDAIRVIEQENLKGYNLDGSSIKSNEIGIQLVESKWIVYFTDERADYRVIKEYECEEDAIAHVVECLRINKKFVGRK